MRTTSLQPVARLHAPGDIRVDDEPRLPVGPGEVLGVAVQAVDLGMIVLDTRVARAGRAWLARIAAPTGRVVLVEIQVEDPATFTASMARPKGLTLVLCRRMTAADHDRTMVDAA